MSQDNPTTPPDAPKRKKGFWSWLTGEREEDASAAPSTETAPAAPEAAAPPTASADSIEAAPAPAGDATAPALPGDTASSGAAAPQGDGPAPSEAPAPAGDVVAAAPLGGAAPSEAAESRVPTPAPLHDAASSGGAAAPAGGATASEAPAPVDDTAAPGFPAPAPSGHVVAAASPEAFASARDGAVPGSLPVPEADGVSPVPAPAVPAAPPAASASGAAGSDAAPPAPDVPPVPVAPAPAADEPPPAAPVPAPEEAAAAEPARKGFWGRLVSGLARTAGNLGQGITDLVSKRKLDADTLEELEDVLIRADLGTDTAARIVAAVGKGRHDKMISPEEVKGLIAQEVETILAPVAKPLVVDVAHKPFVVLMVGVNGSGKTTTIGKLAAQWRAEGRKVVLAAGDTFRAAAIEQLKVWGQRTGAHVIAREQGADAAGVAHDALTEARAAGADILMIDTAGRLQNRAELMAELEKVVRVIRKLEASAPHAVLLVLDATVGQNALSQVEAFTRIAGVTGLVMTKLDGTARGGILVAIAAKHKLPVHLIGVGESADDLQPFAARDFARAIAGLD